jgi:hypothetical protein
MVGHQYIALILVITLMTGTALRGEAIKPFTAQARSRQQLRPFGVKPLCASHHEPVAILFFIFKKNKKDNP